MTEEMLIIDPLLPQRGAAEQGVVMTKVNPLMLHKNRHPRNLKRARSQTASHRSLPIKGGRQLGTNSVKSTHACPRRDQDRPETSRSSYFKNDIADMMKDMIKTSLTDLGVVPKPTPQQSQSSSK